MMHTLYLLPRTLKANTELLKTPLKFAFVPPNTQCPGWLLDFNINLE